MAIDKQALISHFERVGRQTSAPQLAYGVSIGGEVQTARNADVQFRIASMTKSFTAAAILLLRDRGSLALDESAENRVPELRLTKPTVDSPAVTIRHLLTMSSGLASDDPWADRHLDADEAFMNQLFSSGGYFAAPVGSQFVYSNYGYAILGRVITNVTGKTFQQFITDELLTPLGMTSTTWQPIQSNYALPHREQDGVAVDEGVPVLNDGGFAAMGGLWSTVADLLRWVQFFLDAGLTDQAFDEAPLGGASRREMQRVSTFFGRNNFSVFDTERIVHGGYGMGLFVQEDDDAGPVIHHTGGLPGYGSNMLWLPRHGLAVVSMANITYAHMRTANAEAVEVMNFWRKPLDDSGVVSDEIRRQALALVDLFNSWDETAAENLFADNVALDESFERRRAALEKLKASVDTMWRVGEITAQNAAEGQVALNDETDKAIATLRFSLSPTIPPKVQWYSIAGNS